MNSVGRLGSAACGGLASKSANHFRLGESRQEVIKNLLAHTSSTRLEGVSVTISLHGAHTPMTTQCVPGEQHLICRDGSIPFRRLLTSE